MSLNSSTTLSARSKLKLTGMLPSCSDGLSAMMTCGSSPPRQAEQAMMPSEYWRMISLSTRGV